tara:strand:- start:1501 stop:2127 length:627 start_codon:yes stop_codon:yes gene_type:complete
MMLELSLGCPSYVQSFFDEAPTSCWGLHIHNRRSDNSKHPEGPVVGLKKVIYLYRDPVDTIYSNLKYERILDRNWNGNASLELHEGVNRLVSEYKRHLHRWMINNDDVESFMPLTYEDLKRDAQGSLTKISEFLNASVCQDRILESIARCDKSLTKRLTPHDKQALNSEHIDGGSTYTDNREKFKSLFGNHIESKFSEVLMSISTKYK